MTKPAQVLDEQGALIAHAKSDPYIAMATRMLADVIGKSHMLGEKWADRALPHTYAHWREMVVPSLEIASAYHVSNEMTTLAQWAGHLLPEDVTLKPDDVPTASGFLMFEDALVGREVWGRTTYTHAILWRPMTSRYIDYNRGAGIEVFCFNSFHDTRDEVTQKILRDLKERGIDPIQQVALLGHLSIDHVVSIPYGETQEPVIHLPEDYGEGWEAHRREDWTEGRSPIPDNENWIRTLIALFNLMNQTVTDTREVDVDRKTAKRARRMNLPGRVTIIHLRRTEGSRSDHESDIEWQHRWVVRGHWRNQPYGSGEDKHYERIWIAPFVKGPADAPFKVSDKVYTLDR